MKVFISWSDELSRAIATELRSWLPLVVQHVKPWMSEEEIGSGARWNDLIGSALEDTDFGIVCVTSSNQHRPWLMFEAGALAKRLRTARVVPLCVNITPAEITGPLGAFQSRILDEDGMRRLVRDISQSRSEPLPASQVDRLFKNMWPDLSLKIDLALADDPPDSESARRSSQSMLEELVERVRGVEREREDPAKDDLKTVVTMVRSQSNILNQLVQDLDDLRSASGSAGRRSVFTGNPIAARRRLGAALRNLRTSSYLKIEDAALALKSSNRKIANLELGIGVTTMRDVRELIALYGSEAEGRADELFELAVEGTPAGGALVEVHGSTEDAVDFLSERRRYSHLEQSADRIRVFEPEMVPSLLAIDDYSRAVVRMFSPDSSASDVERLASFRSARQDILRSECQISFVLAEQVLARPVGDSRIMRAQLECLADIVENDLLNAEFYVVPLTYVAPAVVGGAFSIFEFEDPREQSVVHLGSEEGVVGTYLERNDQVQIYADRFDSLASAAVDRRGSIAMIRNFAAAIAEDYRG